MVKAPLRLLAVDPSLTATGVLACDVVGFGDVRPLWGETITSDPQFGLGPRALHIANLIADCCQRASDIGSPIPPGLRVVMEDPEGHTRSDARESRDPRTTHKLGVGTGVVLLELLRQTAPGTVTVVPVSRWYPRAGGARRQRKSFIIGRARGELASLGRVSEHVCMALGIADWWSRNIAPQIWAVAEGLIRERQA